MAAMLFISYSGMLQNVFKQKVLMHCFFIGLKNFSLVHLNLALTIDEHSSMLLLHRCTYMFFVLCLF